MITPMKIYWLARATPILTAINISCFLLVAVAMGMSTVGAFSDEKEERERYFAYAKKFGIAVVLCGILATLMPTTKDLAAMIVIPKVANSESVQQLGDNITELAKQWLVDIAPKKEAK